jgi:hypothetical protein
MLLTSASVRLWTNFQIAFMKHYYLKIIKFHTEILFKTTKAAIRYMKHLLKPLVLENVPL